MSLEKEYQFFKDNREELLTKYRDRFIVILGEAVVGDYGSEMEAYTEAKKRYEVGTFLIQHCIADDEGSTQIFHSRVSFPANAQTYRMIGKPPSSQSFTIQYNGMVSQLVVDVGISDAFDPNSAASPRQFVQINLGYRGD